MLVDRREELGRARAVTVNRIHRLLLELVPGGARRWLSARQARAMAEEVAPGDPATRMRLRVVGELIDDLEILDARIKAANKELRQSVAATGSTLMELPGIGPAGAAAAARRGRRYSPLRHPGPVRVLERHRPLGCLLGRSEAPPAFSHREPQDQPRVAHHGDGSTVRLRRWARLRQEAQIRRQDSQGSTTSPETAPVQHRLHPHARRPTPTRGGKPGRAIGGDY
ncbi:hypothetical protein ABIA39_007906 [Nocardia sp. GAS34]